MPRINGCFVTHITELIYALNMDVDDVCTRGRTERVTNINTHVIGANIHTHVIGASNYKQFVIYIKCSVAFFIGIYPSVNSMHLTHHISLTVYISLTVDISLDRWQSETMETAKIDDVVDNIM